MLQRVGLAQALINDPTLVVLDEPLGGLDPIGRKEIRDIIVRFKDEGKTVFFTSHILQDIEMICDRVAIIVGGRIVRQGGLRDLVSEKVLFTEVTVSGPSRRRPFAAWARASRPRATGCCSRSTTRPRSTRSSGARPRPPGPAHLPHPADADPGGHLRRHGEADMKIGVIAVNTFKEAMRDRILYLLFFFAALGIVASRVLALLTVGDRLKIIKDVGLASISFFGVLMAILIGTGPRLQGDRQADDLHPHLQAHPPGRVHPGQVLRAGPDAARHDRGDDPHLPGPRLRPHPQDRGRSCSWPSPSSSSSSS